MNILLYLFRKMAEAEKQQLDRIITEGMEETESGELIRDIMSGEPIIVPMRYPPNPETDPTDCIKQRNRKDGR